MNGTPIDWYSKRQATVETATYGSEFVAARIAVDQIIDLWTTLRYLGVPINGSTYMFGDKQLVVKSSSLPTSALNKQHNALSYHRVWEAVAAGIIIFHHISGKENPADVLSKHCGYPDAWPKIQPFLFWRGTFASSAPPDGECQELHSKTRNGLRKTGNTALNTKAASKSAGRVTKLLRLASSMFRSDGTEPRAGGE